MAHDDGRVYWYDPDPRAIIPLDQFHVPKRLARTVQQALLEVRVNSAFTAVMQACAQPTPDRESTWINYDILEAYTELHRLGFAHSVECWQDGQLVGGLYGVAVQGLFAGESMFSRVTNSSKVALVHLVGRLRRRGYQLLDIQFMTEHLARFGAVEISASEYKQRLGQALLATAVFANENGGEDD